MIVWWSIVKIWIRSVQTLIRKYKKSLKLNTKCFKTQLYQSFYILSNRAYVEGQYKHASDCIKCNLRSCTTKLK